MEKTDNDTNAINEVDNSNGQTYCLMTKEAIEFFQEKYSGSYSDLGREAGLSSRTVGSAMKGKKISLKTAKKLREALGKSGFKGTAFIKVISQEGD